MNLLKFSLFALLLASPLLTNLVFDDGDGDVMVAIVDQRRADLRA
jgi:hypothetical protein